MSKLLNLEDQFTFYVSSRTSSWSLLVSPHTDSFLLPLLSGFLPHEQNERTHTHLLRSHHLVHRPRPHPRYSRSRKIFRFFRHWTNNRRLDFPVPLRRCERHLLHPTRIRCRREHPASSSSKLRSSANSCVCFTGLVSQLLYAPVLLSLGHLSNLLYSQHHDAAMKYAGIAFVASWIAQFVGHGKVSFAFPFSVTP